MGELRPWHLAVIAVVLFVLFGYKKLPDATRSLGRSLRILKAEVSHLHDEELEAVAEQPRLAPPPLVPERSLPATTPIATHAPTIPAPPPAEADHR
jgi:sec-independent protein translocase protein TatA